MTSGSEQQASQPRWQLPLALVSVAAAAWLVYARGLGAWWRHDDFWWLATAQRWANGSLPLTDAPAGVAPVYNLLYYLTFRQWGLEPRPYFTELLLCHVVNALLVFALARRLTASQLAATAAGLFFALHYVHHEAIVWPAGGCHAFAMTFILLAVLAWLRYRAGQRWGLPASVALAGAALLTKDSGIAFLPILLAIELTVQRAAPKRVLLWHALPLLALVAWRLLMPPAADPKAMGSSDFSLGLHQLANLALCVPQMLLPDPRFENYAALLAKLLPGPALGVVNAMALAAMLGLTGLALVGLRRGGPLTRLGLLWCYFGFAPYTPFSYAYARAPRYLYIASAGLALLVGLLAARVGARWPGWSRPRRAMVVAGAGVYLLMSLGFARMVCSNRLRDSAVRRQAVELVLRRVPLPEPNATFRLAGLPGYIDDLDGALWVSYGQPVRVLMGDGPLTPGMQIFRFSLRDGRVALEFYKRFPGTPAPIRLGVGQTLPSGHPDISE